MFVVLLNYVRPLAEVDKLIPEHMAFLDECYATGAFVASGRMVPRVGGVILVAGNDRALLESLLARDPFHRAQVAEYTIHEFMPTRMKAGFDAFTGI